jgi:hypothetical protein
LEADLRATKEAETSVPTNCNHSLKNGIWGRVSAQSKMIKAIDILGLEESNEENANTKAPHDNSCHTTCEDDEQRPPLNPIFATAAVRRGIGRKGKCGRKRKTKSVLLVEDKEKKTKGVDNHKDYMEVVKSVLALANKCDQSVRIAATHAQTTLFDNFNITISHPWCRALISTFIQANITLPTPQNTGGPLIPIAIEERFADVVRRVRNRVLEVAT